MVKTSHYERTLRPLETIKSDYNRDTTPCQSAFINSHDIGPNTAILYEFQPFYEDLFTTKSKKDGGKMKPIQSMSPNYDHAKLTKSRRTIKHDCSTDIDINA